MSRPVLSRARIRAMGSLLIGILLGLAIAAAWGRLPGPGPSPDPGPPPAEAR